MKAISLINKLNLQLKLQRYRNLYSMFILYEDIMNEKDKQDTIKYLDRLYSECVCR